MAVTDLSFNEEMYKVGQIYDNATTETSGLMSSVDKDKIDRAVLEYRHVIDLTDTTVYDENTWYPVVSRQKLSTGKFNHLILFSDIHASGRPSWGTHDSLGFTCFLDVLVRGAGWGTTYGETIIRSYASRWAGTEHPHSYQQLRNSSYAVFFLRGGGKYTIATDFDTLWGIYTEPHTFSEQTVSPQSSTPGLDYSNTMYTISIKAVNDSLGNNIAETFERKANFFKVSTVEELNAITPLVRWGDVVYVNGIGSEENPVEIKRELLSNAGDIRFYQCHIRFSTSRTDTTMNIHLYYSTFKISAPNTTLSIGMFYQSKIIIESGTCFVSVDTHWNSDIENATITGSIKRLTTGSVLRLKNCKVSVVVDTAASISGTGSGKLYTPDGIVDFGTTS